MANTYSVDILNEYEIGTTYPLTIKEYMLVVQAIVLPIMCFNKVLAKKTRSNKESFVQGYAMEVGRMAPPERNSRIF